MTPAPAESSLDMHLAIPLPSDEHFVNKELPPPRPQPGLPGYESRDTLVLQQTIYEQNVTAALALAGSSLDINPGIPLSYPLPAKMMPRPRPPSELSWQRIPL